MTAILHNAIELTENELEAVNGGRTASTAQYYVIQKGDTLTRIAYRFHTTIKHLMDMNPKITNPNKIYAGDKIRIK